MHPTMTEEHVMLVETVNRYARQLRETMATEHTTAEVPRWGALREARDLGLLNVAIPEAFGGLGLDRMAQALSVSGLAEGVADVAVTVAVHQCATDALSAAGEPVRSTLEGLAASEDDRPSLVGVAFPEVTASDARVIDGKLSGTMLSPIDVESCDHVVVAGAEMEGDAALALFPAETLVRFRRQSYCGTGLEGFPHGRLAFDGLNLGEATAVVKTPDSERLVSTFKLLLAAAQVGNARAALAGAAGYAQERKQTGRVIIDHQNVRAMVARMVMLTNAAESFVLHVATDDQAMVGPFDLCRQAYSFSGEVAEQVCLDAIQTLGGYGYMKDYGLERRLRDCKTMQALTGDHIADALGVSVNTWSATP